MLLYLPYLCNFYYSMGSNVAISSLGKSLTRSKKDSTLNNGILSERRNKIGKNEKETKSGTMQSETCLISRAVPENPERIVTLPKLNKLMKNRFGTYRFCSVLKSEIALISYRRLPSRQFVWNTGLYVERTVSYWLHYSHNFAAHCLLTSKIRKINGKVRISHKMSRLSAVLIRHFAIMHVSQFVL